MKRYFFDPEVAAAFGVSRRTLARWREGGMIGWLAWPGGQKVLYLARHLIEFLQRSEHVPRPRGRPRKHK